MEYGSGSIGLFEQTLSEARKKTFEFDCGDLPLSEFDLGGVLYHANYFRVFERAREALFARRELPYHTLANQGAHLAVLESRQHFIKPIHYGDNFKVNLWVSELKAASLRINYELHLEKENKLAHRAWMRMVYVEKKDVGEFKMRKFPHAMRAIFIELDC